MAKTVWHCYRSDFLLTLRCYLHKTVPETIRQLTEHQISFKGKVISLQTGECWETDEVTLGNQSKNCCLIESKQQDPHFVKYLMTFYSFTAFGLYVAWYSPSDRLTLFSPRKLWVLYRTVILWLSYQRWTHESVMWAEVASQIGFWKIHKFFKKDCFSNHCQMQLCLNHTIRFGNLRWSGKVP
jgi:hypothetical protein